jgi:hypothetical protein
MILLKPRRSGNRSFAKIAIGEGITFTPVNMEKNQGCWLVNIVFPPRRARRKCGKPCNSFGSS